MSNPQSTSLATSRGSGAGYAVEKIASRINTAQPLISTQTMQQVLGSSTDTKLVNVPALAANVPQQLTFTIPLSGFPSPFQINKAGSGLVQANVQLALAPTHPSTLVSMPVVSLFFGTGQTAPGSTSWTLRAGVSYQGAALQVKVTVQSASSVPAQQLTFISHAQLIAIPAS